MQDLTDKVVVVTGASRGIGAAIARAFAEQNCALVLTARKKTDLEKSARSLKLPKDRVLTVTADITKATGMRKIVSAAFKKFGRVDIFVNNAGVGIEKKLINMTEKEYDQIFDTNVKAVFYSFKELLPRFENQGHGHVINISSMAGKQGHGSIAAYAASKAALNSLCEGVAAEVRNENVKISVLAPGSTDTAFRYGMESKQKDRMPSQSSKKKLAASEVAEAVVFMARQNDNAWLSMAEMRPLITKA